MTAVILLEELKKYIEGCTKDIVLKTRSKPSSNELMERPAQIHSMRLPNKESQTKLVPYILMQFLTGKDDQLEGQSPESECRIRIVVATYSEDESEGALDVLNVLTRIRIALLKDGIVGGQFSVKKPIEYIVYPDDTAPYYMGEMITIWEMPEVEREVRLW